MSSRVARRRASPIPIVIATVFVDVVGFAMILPLLPSYAARLGGSPTAIGLAVASYSALQLLLAPFWGRVSDRFGRRPVLLIGLAGSVVSYLLFAAADTFALLLISRLVDGGSGASVSVAQAYLADETRPGQRARAMGIVGAAVGFAFVVGPVLGGLTSTLGAAAPGLVAAGITMLNLVAALVWLPESRRRRVAAPVGPAPLPWRSIAAPTAVLTLSTLAFTVMYVAFPLFGEQRLGASRSTVSYWFAFAGLITAIVQGGLLGRIVRHLGEAGTARIGVSLLAGGFMMIGPAAREGAGVAFFATLACLGAGFGMVGPTMTGLISRRTQSDRQGRVLGVAQSATASARIVGPVAVGVVMQVRSAETAFLAAAGVAALGLVAAAALGRRPPVTAATPAP